jgi:glycosyltransferase involved in cell wall biosynthesis
MKFLGTIPQNELIRTLQKSQVFCLASSVEGFGIVVIEALAAGTPFVHSDLTVTREITHNGLGGLFFPVGEVDVLAKQLIRLLTDEKLYRQKQMEGQQLIKQYAWARVAKRTEMIYTKIYEQN